MSELKDYSGEFKSDLRYEEFSKEALVNLLKEFSRSYVMMDGFWYAIAAEHVNPDDAFKWEIEMYTERLYPMIIPRLNKALGIRGNDVATLFKTAQIMPDGGQGILVMNWDLKSKNRGILTVEVCRPLLFMEKEGKGREAIVCSRLEQACLDKIAELTNPRIRVKPLKLPPRKAPDEIACQWEFKLERKT